MIQAVQKRVKNEKGLTLVELLAVIVILAIVAAIAIPAIGSIIENSRGKALKSDVVNVMNAANIYFTDNPDGKEGEELKVDLDGLTKGGYLESKGKLTKATVTYVAGGNTIDADGTNGQVTIAVTGATLDQVNAHSGKPENGKVTINAQTSEGDEG